MLKEKVTKLFRQGSPEITHVEGLNSKVAGYQNHVDGCDHTADGFQTHSAGCGNTTNPNRAGQNITGFGGHFLFDKTKSFGSDIYIYITIRTNWVED